MNHTANTSSFQRLLRPVCAFAIAALLSACVAFNATEPGNVKLGDVTVTATGKWNQRSSTAGANYELLTQEGLPLDQIRVYPGVESGKTLDSVGWGAPETVKQSLLVQANLKAEGIAELVASNYTARGASYKAERIAPAKVLGADGVRIEFVATQKTTEVEYKGIAYGAMVGNKLYLLVFHAPKIHFFSKLQAEADSLMKSARLTR